MRILPQAPRQTSAVLSLVLAYQARAQGTDRSNRVGQREGTRGACGRPFIHGEAFNDGTRHQPTLMEGMGKIIPVTTAKPDAPGAFMDPSE